MKPYSNDLRARVLAALEQGMPRAEVVTTFQVSLASIKRWLKTQRETGEFTPRPARGGPNPQLRLFTRTSFVLRSTPVRMPRWPNTLPFDYWQSDPHAGTDAQKRP